MKFSFPLSNELGLMKQLFRASCFQAWDRTVSALQNDPHSVCGGCFREYLKHEKNQCQRNLYKFSQINLRNINDISHIYDEALSLNGAYGISLFQPLNFICLSRYSVFQSSEQPDRTMNMPWKLFRFSGSDGISHKNTPYAPGGCLPFQFIMSLENIQRESEDRKSWYKADIADWRHSPQLRWMPEIPLSFSALDRPENAFDLNYVIMGWRTRAGIHLLPERAKSLSSEVRSAGHFPSVFLLISAADHGDPSARAASAPGHPFSFLICPNLSFCKWLQNQRIFRVLCLAFSFAFGTDSSRMKFFSTIYISVCCWTQGCSFWAAESFFL